MTKKTNSFILSQPALSLAVSSSMILAASADAPLVAPTAELSAVGNFRIVAGTTPAALTYTLSDLSSADQDLDISIVPFMLGANPAQPFGSLVSLGQSGQDNADLSGSSHSGYTLTADNTADLTVLPSIDGLVAGDSVDLGVQLSGSSWTGPVVSNTSINVVENRLLTGSATLNAGRHILGQLPGGTLTLNGGALGASEGTNISVHSGGFAQYGNGVRLSSASDFTFNGAGQTHDLQVAYHGAAGTYNHTINLSGVNGADNYQDASGNQRHDFGGFWRTEVEMGKVTGETMTRVQGVQIIPRRASDYSSNRVETGQPTPALTYDDGLYSAERGGGVRVNERINPLISGEAIQGSNLDLSGVDLTISGTALRNRRLEVVQSTGTMQTNLGRQMVSGTSQLVNQSGTLTYGSQTGSDDLATRIRLADFNSSGGGVTASYNGGGQDFTGVDGQEVVVDVNANFTVDRSVTGTFHQSLNAGVGAISTLENGGLGLANESVQSGLDINYTWSNVENNQIDIRDQHVFVYDDANLTNRLFVADEAYYRNDSPLENGYTHRVHHTDTHTAIHVDDSFYLSGGTRSLGDQYEKTVTVSGANGRVFAEGLAGEVVTANDTFDVFSHTIGRAALDVTAPAGNQLDVGESIEVVNLDRGLAGTQADVEIELLSFEGSARWTLDYQGDGLLKPGETDIMTTQFDSSGLGTLGGTFTSEYIFATGESIHYGDYLEALYGAESSRLSGDDSDRIAEGLSRNWQLHEFTFKREIEQVASSGSSRFESGADLGFSQPSLTNTMVNTSSGFAVATGATVVDSLELGGGANVSIEFAKIEDASVTDIYGEKGAVADFATDVVDLTGLDGQLHVIELTYDDSALLDPTEEGAMQVMWLTEYDSDPGAGENLEGIWVNAVLGNSDVVALDILGKTVTTSQGRHGIQAYLQSKRYSGTYQSYLNSLEGQDPELGAWGMDASGNTVWAVIDHNSSFAGAIPEPSSVALLGVGAFSLLLRRRR